MTHNGIILLAVAVGGWSALQYWDKRRALTALDRATAALRARH